MWVLAGLPIRRPGEEVYAEAHNAAMNDTLSELQALGLELPSPAYIFGAIVFGLIGLVAWRLGRKQGKRRQLWLGVALMLYPYLVPGTVWLYALGLALCAGLWVSR